MMKLKSRRLPFYKDVKPEDCRSGSGLPYLAAQAKDAAMNMQTEDVKPRRPVQVRRSRWVLGDVAEVLDHNSWRLGKITEVLKNDCFVIRLVGCIQPREVHISCLRVPHDSKQLTVGDRVRYCLEFIFLLVNICEVYLFHNLIIVQMKIVRLHVFELQTTELLLSKSEKLLCFIAT
jgi:hypothetical protein